MILAELFNVMWGADRVIIKEGKDSILFKGYVGMEQYEKVRMDPELEVKKISYENMFEDGKSRQYFVVTVNKK